MIHEFQLFDIQSAQLVVLLDLSKIQVKNLPVSFEFLSNDQEIITISEDNFMCQYSIPHRALFSRQEILLNFSYENTKFKKNSKFIQDGKDLKELENQSKNKD
jgi:hypothetical protein